MPNIPYPSGAQAFASAQINWVSDSISLVLLKSSYVYNAAHDFLNDIPSGDRVAIAAMTGKTNVGGFLTSADVVTGALTAGIIISKYVVYKNTGVEGTSILIFHFDHESSGVPISKTTNGSTVTVTWPNGVAQI